MALITPKIATSSQNIILKLSLFSRAVRYQVLCPYSRGLYTSPKNRCAGDEDSPATLTIEGWSKDTTLHQQQRGRYQMRLQEDPRSRDLFQWEISLDWIVLPRPLITYLHSVSIQCFGEGNFKRFYIDLLLIRRLNLRQGNNVGVSWSNQSCCRNVEGPSLAFVGPVWVSPCPNQLILVQPNQNHSRWKFRFRLGQKIL